MIPEANDDSLQVPSLGQVKDSHVRERFILPGCHRKEPSNLNKTAF